MAMPAAPLLHATSGAAAAALDVRPIMDACKNEVKALTGELEALGLFHGELLRRVLVRTGKPVRLEGEEEEALPLPVERENEEPIVPHEHWDRLPEWIKLSFFRGQLIPGLDKDPLFWGKGAPCLLPFLPAQRPWGRGIALFVPGGNYEFLTPQEGEPLARWLAQDLNIPACVLRYRLLPEYGMQDMATDLRRAIRMVRSLANGGPVAVFGFSAGSHLSALVSSEDGGDKSGQPDVQVFLYPVITADDWFCPSTSGFFRVDEGSDEVRSLAQGQKRLLPGLAFIPPPPTFMVSSTGDGVCPPVKHGDLYAEAMEDAGVPFEHVRGDFGDHGFCHSDFWRVPCLRFLRKYGLGRATE